MLSALMEKVDDKKEKKDKNESNDRKSGQGC